MEKCANTLTSVITADIRHIDLRSGRYFDRKFDLTREVVADVVAELIGLSFKSSD